MKTSSLLLFSLFTTWITGKDIITREFTGLPVEQLMCWCPFVVNTKITTWLQSTYSPQMLFMRSGLLQWYWSNIWSYQLYCSVFASGWNNGKGSYVLCYSYERGNGDQLQWRFEGHFLSLRWMVTRVNGSSIDERKLGCIISVHLPLKKLHEIPQYVIDHACEGFIKYRWVYFR